MAQYINKDALVAWLKERIRDYWCDSYALEEVIKYVDTLEGKDVDLEEEVDKWYNNEAPKEFEHILYRDIENFAKYFFELGLKAQKGK